MYLIYYTNTYVLDKPKNWNELTEEERKTLSVLDGDGNPTYTESTWNKAISYMGGGESYVEFNYQAASWVSIPASPICPVCPGGFTLAGAIRKAEKEGQVSMETVVTGASGLVPIPGQTWAERTASEVVVSLTADLVNNSKPPDQLYTQYLPQTTSSPPPSYFPMMYNNP